MPVKTTLKSRDFDDADKKILMVLQEDGRTPLKEIAKAVNLSVDSVYRRIKELKRKEILHVSTSIDPLKLGYKYVTDNKVKLKASSIEEKKKFIQYLINHPRCIDLVEILGSHDFTCTLVATDSDELVNITNSIKHKFRDIIDDWSGFLVLKSYKFDKYSL